MSHARSQFNKAYYKSIDNRTKIDHCNGKPCYDKKTAVTAKNKRWKESHTALRVYHCPDCNHWHLTHNI